MFRPILHPLFRGLSKDKALVRTLSWGLGLAFLSLISTVGLLAVSGWFITASAFAGVLALIGAINIYTPGAAIRLFAVLRTVSRYGERVFNHDAILKIQSIWRVWTFKQLQQMNVATIKGLSVAQLSHKINRDLSVLELYWLRIATPWLLFLSTSLLMLIVLAIVYWPVAIIYGVFVAFTAWYVRNSAKRAIVKSKAEYTSELDFKKNTYNFLALLPERTAWGLTETHRKSMVEISEQYAKSVDDNESMMGFKMAGTVFIHGVMILLITLTTIHAWQSDRISGPMAVFIVLGLVALAESWQQLIVGSLRYGEVTSALSSLSKLTQETGPKVEVTHCNTNGLVIENLEIYRRERFLLSVQHLKIETRSHVAVLASSGVGKSSLAEAIVGILPLLKGRITWHGQPVSTDTLKAQGISYLMQGDEIFAGSLWENLTLGDASISEQRVWDVLNTVQLGDWVKSHKKGLAMLLESQGANVSGGQARRISLARVLLQDNEFIILDEPFRGIDKATREKIEGKLSLLFKDKTVIYFAHRKEDVPPVDRCLNMTNQQLEEL